MNNIGILFNQIKSYGKNTRLNPDPTDEKWGLTRWNKIKPILALSKKNVEWKPAVKDFFVDMRSTLKLIECEDEIQIKDSKERHMLWEKNHFYLQHARIPTLNYTNANRI